MRRRIVILAVGTSLLALAGCGQAGEDYAESTDSAAAPMADMAMEEAAVAGADGAEASGALAPLASRPAIPVNLPRMAYVYDYGFRLPGTAIAAMQMKHADMCEALGPYQCQIVAMTSSGGEEDYASGRLELAVASDRARAFVNDVAATLEGTDGEQVSASITGEDLSKAMVDTEARLRSRIALRDRLMEVLKNRQGDIADLVEAERSVARINEEIDQARSWMEEMQGRVAFARVNLSYASATPPASDFLDPVRNATASIGAIMGNVLALLILLASVAVPLGTIGLIARAGWRRWRPATAVESA